MATESQILANRLNAQKSTGPCVCQAVISSENDAEFVLNYAKQSQFP
jgi:hypothetical protein